MTTMAMLVVFEGIDGSGKTTISNRVADELRRAGRSVRHAREGGQFASRVTQSIRDVCRDSRNLALAPRTELLLYLAREVQLLEEIVRPALAESDVVIADRFIYTAEVLAQHGRGLPAAVVGPIIAAVRAGDGHAPAIEPDMVILIDVDPSVARGRRKIAKIVAGDRRSPSRKGLAGSGMQIRLRDGYRVLAERDPQRWIAIDNSDADMDAQIARITALILAAQANGVGPAIAEMRAALEAAARGGPAAPVATAREALAAFMAWVDHRARREPSLAAYVLAGLYGPGIDERRRALAPVAPRVLARGLRGLDDAVSWQLRSQLRALAPQEVAFSLDGPAALGDEAWALRRDLLEAAPAEVAASLQRLDLDAAWQLRERLWPIAPDGVMMSLARVLGTRAWQARERWLDLRGGSSGGILRSYEGARIACRAITGLDDARAWEIRTLALDGAPVASIASLEGLLGEHAWAWRARHLDRAPKAVLSTIAGIDDPRAWTMRQATAHRCREALDSMIGLDHPIAWEIRAACLDVWPANVIKSLGPLVGHPRGCDLLLRALARHPDNISLLKQAATVATGGHLHPNVLAA
jgi:dTMP kinase